MDLQLSELLDCGYFVPVCVCGCVWLLRKCTERKYFVYGFLSISQSCFYILSILKKTAETKCSFYEKIERRNANLDFAVLCYSFEKEKSNDLPDQLSLRVILGFIFFFLFCFGYKLFCLSVSQIWFHL